MPTSAAQPAASVAVGIRGRRRRPGMYALAVTLIAAGGLGGFVAWQETGERTPVLTVTRAVPAGDVIDDADLGEASISLDPALKPFKAADREQVVGKRAAVALVPGAMVSRGQVTDRALVTKGEQLVGIGLKANQLPTTPLSPGDRVLVVSTPAEGQGAGSAGRGADAEPESVAARVVRVGDKQEAGSERVVDVAVPADQGPTLAARAASGEVALVVDPGSS
ncbi:SAF domain-containing protein [Streptomyces monticola]|uniref:SAF domain-containing protein n=1 Tax=Streptomyces monticola TaxID=2666263 RepID=A0ABW2JUF9_9ACTN